MSSTTKKMAGKGDGSRLITGWRQLEQSRPSGKRRNPPVPKLLAPNPACAATIQSAKDRWEAEGGATRGKEALKLPK